MLKICCAFICASIILFGCSTNKKTKSDAGILNDIGTRYVKLGLKIGQYDRDFVDAYYGPDSLKPAPLVDSVMKKDSLLGEVNSLIVELDSIIKSTGKEDSSFQRATWMRQQLVAFGRRIRIVSGEKTSFEKETEELFNVTVPVNNEQHFMDMIKRLDSLVPGKGSLTNRLDALNNKFIIPKNKVDTLFKLSLAEARKKTMQHFVLPGNESFKLEYVTGKSWSGYNWYQGKFESLIQINTDLPIMIERALDLACHEGYPGHHVYNMLLEKNLYVDKGWVEISLYPLFSPQSLIAEGSANYGIEITFPGAEKVQFIKNILLPAAGMDTTNLEIYLEVLELKAGLNYARNEVARGLINGKLTEAEALLWLTTYSLASPASAAKSISFIKSYGSYLICYNYGLDLVRAYIEKGNPSTEKHWDRFSYLLSNPVTTTQLMNK
ncbi:MAG: hypothetical protein ABIQ56_01240 [Chitinophagaceae bacterium]